MAMTQKLSDVGWIYHAPSKAKEGQDAAQLPPASQIPGLNEFPEGYFPSDEPKKLQIHEHDSAYVRLAKQGGRPDLLRQRTPNTQPKEPKPYPRVNWFYQDDIKMEEDMAKPDNSEPDAPYEFALPEYMVHQEYKPHGDAAGEHHTRNIFSRDQTNVFQREGRNATNKTVKIAETRAPGYGIRQERHGGRRQPMPKVQPAAPAKPPTPEFLTPYAKLKPMALPKEDDRPAMSKLLAFGYARDWEEQRQQWLVKFHGTSSESMDEKNDLSAVNGNHEKVETEYQSKMHLVNGTGSTGRPRVPSHGRRAPPSSQSRQGSGASAQHRRQKAKDEEEKPAFFSLSQHDNQPGKPHSRRCRSELLPAQLKPK